MNVALPPVSLTESSDEDDRHGQIDIPVDAPDIEIADRLSLRQVIASLEAEDRKLIYLRYFQNKTLRWKRQTTWYVAGAGVKT